MCVQQRTVCCFAHSSEARSAANSGLSRWHNSRTCQVGVAGQVCYDRPCWCMSACLLRQAGTYIKEFVHGDGGRTEPDLATLVGCPGTAQVLALDVLQVHMDF